tara:strand:- start:753 stop:947 length:195 start_codon:yes stop_codon:yes gene_type:complete
MATYKQTFRVPAKALKAWNGTDYTVATGSTVLQFKAVSDAQAFRIAESIAKKNGWTTGQLVKIA